MRYVHPRLSALWRSGSAFVGENRPCTRVTIEKDWRLNYANASEGWRFFQRQSNNQVETEFPQELLSSVGIDRSIDVDAATCTIRVYNVNPYVQQAALYGDPGYYTPDRGTNQLANNRFGLSSTPWTGVLVPEALIRTYQGYGGHDKAIRQAQAEGNLILTGLWLVDSVGYDHAGTLTISCRDMGKLLIEQHLVRPLIPDSKYPLKYARWIDIPETTSYTPSVIPKVLEYDLTDPVSYALNGQPKSIVAMMTTNTGEGYWIVGSDGGVFTFGDAPYFGALGAIELSPGERIVGADKIPDDTGYRLFSNTGGVYSFPPGGPTHWGSVIGTYVLNAPVVGGACDPSKGKEGGYWLVCSDGGVITFNVPFYGSAGNVTLNAPVVGMEVTPSGGGYWLVARDGGVFTYGNAQYWGSGVGALEAGNEATALMTNAFGTAYYISTKTFQVIAYGSGTSYNVQGTADDDGLADPIVGIGPSDAGYRLVAGDGGIFTFPKTGETKFWGSLPGGFNGQVANVTPAVRRAGNYTDYADIIKDLVRMAGFTLGDTTDAIYGTYETTGAYSEEPLPEDMFDSRPVIDAISEIREIVGYRTWIDEEGAFHFELPNWFAPGNNYDNGFRTPDIPVIDETVQLTAFDVTYASDQLRSEIIISSNDPTVPNIQEAKPLFNSEARVFWDAAYAHNKEFALPGPYITVLSAANEQLFRQWVKDNKVPYSVNSTTVVNYDMRGFWLAMTNGEVPPWTTGQHFSDKFKTPYHTSFSSESKYATTNNPFHWQGNRLIDSRNNQWIYGEGVDTGNGLGMVITRFIPPDVGLLRGQIRPAMWVNGYFNNVDEQQRLAELVYLYASMEKYKAGVECLWSPEIQINDQVWVYERTTGEARIHYVRGVSTNHDLDGGSFTMSLTTHALARSTARPRRKRPRSCSKKAFPSRRFRFRSLPRKSSTDFRGPATPGNGQAS